MNKKTYRQLTPEQRHTIQIMRQAGNSQAQMARDLGCAPSTISRELHRNASEDGVYEHAEAQRQTMRRRTDRRGHGRRIGQLWPTVVDLLREGFTSSHVGLFAWLDLSERSCYRLTDCH